MTGNNNSTDDSTNSVQEAQQGDPNTADNAVAHGGKFGTDQTVSQYIPESTKNSD